LGGDRRSVARGKYLLCPPARDDAKQAIDLGSLDSKETGRAVRN
jgi:hypothetical protein